jgi:hypothetical protein
MIRTTRTGSPTVSTPPSHNNPPACSVINLAHLTCIDFINSVIESKNAIHQLSVVDPQYAITITMFLIDHILIFDA